MRCIGKGIVLGNWGANFLTNKADQYDNYHFKKSQNMKTIRIRILISCMACLLITFQAAAQYRADPVKIIAGTDVTELAFGQLNGQLQVNPLPFLGLCARTSFRATQEQRGNFTEQTKGFLVGGEMRIYPFGVPRQFDAATLMARGFRAFSNYDDNWMQIYLRGLYLGLGAEYRKMDLTYLPDAQLQSPWPSFDYNLRELGGTLQLGYSIAVNRVYAGFGYRLRFSRPSWEGPVDIFGDRLLTQTYPFSYRQRGSLQVEIGIAF